MNIGSPVSIVIISMFNCLPVILLDGGRVFGEMVLSRTGKIIKTEEKREKISHAIVTGLALLVPLSSIFLPVGPYLLPSFIWTSPLFLSTF